MTEFTLIIGIIFGSLLTGFLCLFSSVRALSVLQQEGYSGKEYVRWYLRKDNLLSKRYSLLALSLFLLTALFSLCFSFLGYRSANLISALPYVGIFLLFLFAERKYALKVKFRATGRAVRLCVCHYLLLCIFSCGLCFALAAIAFAVDKSWLYQVRFVPMCILPLISPFLLAVSNFVMKGVELPRNRRFLSRAERALKESSCKKVGITGSCGKTSVKWISEQLLSQKFRVIATPASFNTPLGIARTVNEKGLDCDIFLAEMGARKRGDVVELCALVNPDYAVVTSVYPQHLKTFLSVDAIVEEKGVLARSVSAPILGKTAFDGGMNAPNALVEGVDFGVKDVKLSAEGTQFCLMLPDGEISVSTSLLGAHAAEDIALAAMLCHQLGMTKEEIASAVEGVRQIPHRLQRMDGNGLVILDDSYNANVAGVQNALQVLRLFEGKKCVVTPGIVELGILEEEENYKLGKSLVGLDLVLLVGETLAQPIKHGYLDGGGDAEKIEIVPTLQSAVAKMREQFQAGDCVLFLNDLPDRY